MKMSSLSGTTPAKNDVEHHEVNAADTGAKGFAINEVVMVKLRVFKWPGKILEKIDAETFKIRMYDKKKTKKFIKEINLSKFEHRSEFPDSLPKGWKTAYTKAIQDLEFNFIYFDRL